MVHGGVHKIGMLRKHIVSRKCKKDGSAVAALCIGLFCLKIILFIHTLHVNYAHAVANLNSGYSKYAKSSALALFLYNCILNT